MRERKAYMREYQNKWLSRRRMAWIKKNGPCKQCGSNNNLQVDHINPENKVTHRVWSLRPEIANKELKKCQVLCRDCHIKKTSKENSLRFKGRENPKLQKHSDELLIKVFVAIEMGYPERVVSQMYGVPRGTISSMKFKEHTRKRYKRVVSGVVQLVEQRPVKTKVGGAEPPPGAKPRVKS